MKKFGGINMKRLWVSRFKGELDINLKGNVEVKLKTSLLFSSFDSEFVQVIIHNDCFEQPFVHNIGMVDNVMHFDPIDVAQSFIRYYKGLIENKFFKRNN